MNRRSPRAPARFDHRLLLLAALGVSISCSSATPLPAPFVFDTPGEMELVCFNRLESGDEEKLVSDNDIILPSACCEPAGCTLEDINLPNVKPEDFSPVSHALVTQITDGALAVVDLESRKVLDSERRIPGYTFVDVGGLPTAVVVPKKMPPEPATAEPMEADAAPPTGPIWTYVAGSELNSIRAIPTCRFLLGRACGPELASNEDGELGERPNFRQQTEMPLPAAAQDMVLDPRGDALWVTLPSLGLIARVQLGASADRLSPGVNEAEPPVAPFAFDVEMVDGGIGEDAGLEGEPPAFVTSYFQVEGGLDLAASTPGPIAESTSYEAVCGLGYPYVGGPVPPGVLRDAGTGAGEETDAGEAIDAGEASDAGEATDGGAATDDGGATDGGTAPVPGAPTRQLVLPNAPRVPSKKVPEPTRMRLVPGNTEGDAPLLFVADYGQVVLHTYAIEGAGLTRRGPLYVGARLRDFAVTPKVPELAPPVSDLKSMPPAYEPPPPQGKQYVYGIDEFGGVLAFELSFEGSSPRLQQLLAPLPRRDTVDIQNNFADRIWTSTAESPARGLDVVDTRYSDLAAHSDEYCGQVSQGTLNDIVEEKEGDLKKLQEMLKSAKGSAKQALEDQIEVAQKDLDAAKRRAAVREESGPEALRGVFVVIAASDGRVTVLDVHDLDLHCRVAKSCTGDDLSTLSEDPDAEPVAVRRHTVRLQSFAEDNVSVLGERELVTANVSCPEGYRPVEPEEESGVCVPNDPWRLRDGTWSVAYEGGVFDISFATLESSADPDKLVLRAPAGMDLCKRGALGGEFKAAIGSPPDDAPESLRCNEVTADTTQRLLVTDAFSDRLELALLPPEDDRNSQTVEELMACYPRFVAVRMQLHEAYTVINGLYQHRVRSVGEEQHCEEDTSLDPRLTSKVRPGGFFEDPSIAFTLLDPANAADREDINPSVTLGRQATVLTRVNIDSNSGRTDALPRRVRYFPETGGLFIIDRASQGLRQYTLSPFEASNSSTR